MTKKSMNLKRKSFIMIMINVFFTQELNKLGDNFAANLTQAKLATKADIVDFVKNTDFDKNLKKK